MKIKNVLFLMMVLCLKFIDLESGKGSALPGLPGPVETIGGVPFESSRDSCFTYLMFDDENARCYGKLVVDSEENQICCMYRVQDRSPVIDQFNQRLEASVSTECRQEFAQDIFNIFSLAEQLEIERLNQRESDQLDRTFNAEREENSDSRELGSISGLSGNKDRD